MADPAHNRRLFLFAAALLLIGAAFLRFQQIDRRPFHADEAVQAYQTWQLLRGEGYTYDPADKHGPFLYYAAVGFVKISGWSPAALNETRLRSFTLLAGLGTLVLILANAGKLGGGTVLIAAVLLAVAPLAIIYDTYFVQEAWFCLLTWALFFAVMRWWAKAPLDQPVGASLLATGESREQARSHSSKSRLGGAVLIGALAGLMQAAKETSVLHFAALGVALLATRYTALGGTRPSDFAKASTDKLDGFSPASVEETRPEAGFHRKNVGCVLAALFTALFVYVLFYSACFTRWAGVTDGLRAYFNYAARAAGSAHDQPWHYYFSMLWPHSSGGVRFGEPLLLAAALMGAVSAFTSRANTSQRALTLFTLTLLLLYSIIPYKMPWLLLTPYVGLTLLAGLGTTQSAHWLPAKLSRLAPAVLCLVLVSACVWRTYPALDRYANDDRNPYVYQPTSADLGRLVTTVAALPAGRKIAVVSPDHAWPLPWYWRERAATGYFVQPPANLAAYDFVLFDSRLDSPLPASVTAFGLRPNVILWAASP